MERLNTLLEILERRTMPVQKVPDTFVTTERLASTIEQFCRLYNVTAEQLLSPSRQHHLVEIRQLCWFLCYTRLRLTYTLIGRIFNRHHTTVLHGIRQIETLMDTEPVLRDHINSIDLWIDLHKTQTVEIREIPDLDDYQTGHS